MRPEVHTPVASRSMVRTVRWAAAGADTYVGRVTGIGSQRVGSVIAGVWVVSSSGSGVSSMAGAASIATSTGAARRARSPLTISRHATSHATSSPAGIPTYAQWMRPNAATAPVASSATSSRPSIRRRRRAARLVASRVIGSGSRAEVCLVVTIGDDGARPGLTTSRASRRLTGSRRARTRIVFENRSTDRLRTASSWCRSACGIR